MKAITVFTPTFNRAYCLHQVYESLVTQTSADFLWLVVDDGSSDGTRDLVNSWIAEGKMDIAYIFQQNQGMHGAHNTAYKNITTELNVCVDSDDYMPKDAIEKILRFWKTSKKETWAGILGLDAFKDGRIVGTPFPAGMTQCKYYQLKSVHGVVGDKKFVYRTDVIKKYPEYPVFEGEKFVPLGYKYMLIDQDYDLGVLHEVLCIVEYMADGSSKNIIRQYRKNPHGFAHERKQRMVYSHTFKERFINAAHYVSSAIFTKNGRFLNESPKKGLTLLAVPMGVLLNLYVRYTSKSGVMK